MTHTDRLELLFKDAIATRTKYGRLPLERSELKRYRLHECEYGMCERSQAPPLIASRPGPDGSPCPTRLDAPMPLRVGCAIAVMLYPLMFKPVALLMRYGPSVESDEVLSRALTILRNLASIPPRSDNFLRQRLVDGDSPEAVAANVAKGEWTGSAKWPDGSVGRAHVVMMDPDGTIRSVAETLLGEPQRDADVALAQALLAEYDEEMRSAVADMALVAGREAKKLAGVRVDPTGSAAQKASQARARRGWSLRRVHTRKRRD